MPFGSLPKVVIDLPFEGRKAEESRKYRRRKRIPQVGSRREKTITEQSGISDVRKLVNTYF